MRLRGALCTLTRSTTATPLTQRLALAAMRMGTGTAWMFELSVGLAVALAVAALLVALDGMSWGTALLAGALALLPALLAGAVALHLARALAESHQQREMLMLDDDLEGVSSRRQFLRLSEIGRAHV